MKATVYERTIALLEQEIEAIDQRRAELLGIIGSLRPLAGEASRTRGRRKTAAKRNERTNEQSAGQIAPQHGASLT